MLFLRSLIGRAHSAPAIAHRLCLSILMALIVFLIAGCKVEGKLIDEIQSSGAQDRFKPRDVSQIVARYIPLDTEKQEALRRLKHQGFDVREVAQEIPGCPDCEPLSITASYVQKHFMPFLPDKSYVSILLGVRGGKIAHIAASQSGNPF
jgi:hypothetical protein